MAKEVTGYLFCRKRVWYVRFGYQGRRFTHSLRTRKERDARIRMAHWMVKVRDAIGDGTFAEKFGREPISVVPDARGLPLHSMWQRYVAAVQRPDTGPATLRQYEYQIKRFVVWMQEKHPEVQNMDAVTKPIAREFASSISTALSAGSFNKYIRLLSLVFRVLADEAGFSDNPWGGITRRRHIANSRRPFTDEELKRIFNTAQGETLTLCLIGCHTALRLGDCCLLDWSEVDMSTRRITRTPRKTARSSGKKVIVPLHLELFDHLQKLRPAAAKGYVCPGFADAYLKDTAMVTDKLQALFRECGIRLHREGTGKGSGKRAVIEMGFHSFRHTWATTRAANGVDAATIREIVGWGSPAMERIYTHVSVSQLERAIAIGTAVTESGMQATRKVSPVVDVLSLDDETLAQLLAAAEAEAKRRHIRGGPAIQEFSVGPTGPSVVQGQELSPPSLTDAEVERAAV